jgi:hypothetical protein
VKTGFLRPLLLAAVLVAPWPALADLPPCYDADGERELGRSRQQYVGTVDSTPRSGGCWKADGTMGLQIDFYLLAGSSRHAIVAWNEKAVQVVQEIALGRKMWIRGETVSRHENGADRGYTRLIDFRYE